MNRDGELRRQLSVLRHWGWRILATALLAAGVAFFGSGTLPKSYEGVATLIVGQSLSGVNPDYNEVLTSQRISQTFAEVATTRPILERAIEKLGLRESPEDLIRRVKVEAPRESTLVRIVATDRDPDRAAEIANGLADELVNASPAIEGRQDAVRSFIDEDLTSLQGQITRMQDEVDRLLGLPSRSPAEEQQLEAAQNRLVTLRSTYATLLSFSSTSSANLLSIVEPATPSAEPASPRILLNTLLAAVLALLVATGVAFVVEHLDDTIKTSEEIEEAIGLPTLGAIAQMRGNNNRSQIYRLATLLYPRSPTSEAYRTLRTNIEFARVGRPLDVLLVTSSVPGEGKTTTAANLAVVFAQSGRRTLLLDADMRKPAVHKIFNLPNGRGLSDLFRQDLPAQSLAHPTEQDGLSVLTSGPLPPNPAELLASPRFEALLQPLRDAFDLVVVDTPPLQAVTDAAIVSAIADGALFVVHAGKTRRGAVIRGRDALARSGAHVLGVVLNRLTARAQGNYYYYEQYEAYGGPDGDRPARRTSRQGPSPRPVTPAVTERD